VQPTEASAPSRGLPRVGRSTVGRSSGASLLLDLTLPVAPRGVRRAMPLFQPGSRRSPDGPLPKTRPDRRSRLRPRGQGRRTDWACPEASSARTPNRLGLVGEPTPVAGWTRDRQADPWSFRHLHADPVARALGPAPPTCLRGAVGVPRGDWPVAPVSVTHRRTGGLGAQERAPAPVASGEPVARDSGTSGFSPRTEPAPAAWPVIRFPRSALRRELPEDSFPRPGWRALPGTGHTFADTKPQVKRYFLIHTVIH
jgi:hypothetical protein